MGHGVGLVHCVVGAGSNWLMGKGHDWLVEWNADSRQWNSGSRPIRGMSTDLYAKTKGVELRWGCAGVGHE